MINFSELDVQVQKSFIGPKISIEELDGKEVIVEHFEVKPSTKKAGTDCLHLQIIYEGKQRVIFTTGVWLIKQLRQVKDENFPFKATIRKVNWHYEFK